MSAGVRVEGEERLSVSVNPARIFVGVGSNVRPEESVERALEILDGTPGLTLLGISTLYRTPALSAPGEAPNARSQDPDFLNCVLEFRTFLTAVATRELLEDVEKRLGRARSRDRYAPRTLDLDLLLYLPEEVGSHVATGKTPPIPPPHPEIRSRPFVALPLLELAPGLKLPPDDTPLERVAAGFPDPGGTPETALTRLLRARFLGN